MKSRNPKLGEVKVEPHGQVRGAKSLPAGRQSESPGPGRGSSRRVEKVIDNPLMRKLDESGFIERAYAAQGVKF